MSDDHRYSWRGQPVSRREWTRLRRRRRTTPRWVDGLQRGCQGLAHFFRWISDLWSEEADRITEWYEAPQVRRGPR